MIPRLESSWGVRRYEQVHVGFDTVRTLVYRLTSVWTFRILRRSTDYYNAAAHRLDRTIVGAAAQFQ